MKQKPNEIRKLAIKLYNASEKHRVNHATAIWGWSKQLPWKSMSGGTMDCWDAVSVEACKQLRIIP
jgi:hypothetical protein